jgi:hypothetical protein
MTRTPSTVYAVAQWIRHTRGALTSAEKWIDATPPAQLAAEGREVIALGRVLLAELETILRTSRSTTAPSSPSPDRSAEQAARGRRFF